MRTLPPVNAPVSRPTTADIAEAIIVAADGSEPEVYDLDGFITPREALLTGSRLVGFREWELSGRTEVFGDLAHHLSTYAKSGIQDGQPFTGRGVKSIQCVRTARGWQISAVVWNDEREGWMIADRSETRRDLAAGGTAEA